MLRLSAVVIKPVINWTPVKHGDINSTRSDNPVLCSTLPFLTFCSSFGVSCLCRSDFTASIRPTGLLSASCFQISDRKKTFFKTLVALIITEIWVDVVEREV